MLSMIKQEPRLVSFTIEEPFDVALRMLRRALAREGLRVPCELSTSGRLRQELGVGLRDGTVLYVDAPILLLEATVFTLAGSLYIPEPVALAASGDDECKAVVRSIKPLLDDSLPTTVREAMLLLHERILRAIQSIGHREPVFHHMHKREPVHA
jgi:hypothetical protein